MRQVYGTQGGGLAEQRNGIYVFVEVPKWATNYMNVGDPVPSEWDITGPFDQDNGMAQVADESDSRPHDDDEEWF